MSMSAAERGGSGRAVKHGISKRFLECDAELRPILKKRVF